MTRVMTGLSILLIALTSLWATPAAAQATANDRVVKTVCASAIGYDSLAQIKDDLLLEAKREAANELFGELISAATTVENLVVTADQIRVQSLGLIRMEGSTFYNSGTDPVQVCVTATAYVTAEDRSMFIAEPISGRSCLNDAALTLRDLRSRAETTARVNALEDYDSRLSRYEHDVILPLLRRISFIESRLPAGTDTYCATVTGEVIPIEVISFLGLDGDSPTMAATTPTATRPPRPASPTSTGTNTLLLDETPPPTSTPNFDATVIAAVEATQVVLTSIPTSTSTNTPLLTATWTPTPTFTPTDTPVPTGTPTPSDTPGDTVVVKAACAFTFEYRSMVELRNAIETKAKQMAVGELFGEVITSLTTVENFEVTGDTIISYIEGVVRVRNIEFYNGQNLGEICVSVTAYITERELDQMTQLAKSTSHAVSPTPERTVLPAQATATAFANSTPTFTATPSPTPDSTNTAVALMVDVLATAEAAPHHIYDLWVNPVDEAVYVYVPAGEFTMGSGDGRADEQPVHRVYLDAYWIMRTEVTNAQYDRCVRAGVCTAPSTSVWRDVRYADHPAAVDWELAATYAQWVGGSLPTEAQWEKACRGADLRTYPWGNQEPAASLLNFSGSGVGGTSAVGSYPTGASPNGALDMAGNVWEWAADWYDAGYYAKSPTENPSGPESGSGRVLRGGSFGHEGQSVRCDYRSRDNPPPMFKVNYSDRGFRVVFPDF